VSEAASQPRPEPPEPLSHREAAELASRFNLRKLGARPAVAQYVEALYRRRHFIWALASSDAYGRNQGSYLGQLWGVLNPLLHFAVFWIVFGIGLRTGAGTQDFISYLAVGTFLYGFVAAGLNQGCKAVSQRLALVRALEFPRAVLPISVTLTEMIMVWPALVVMVVILLLRGNPLGWSWLGLIPLVGLMYVFTLGCTFFLARLVAFTPDYQNLVPVATTMLRFVSGVFYDIAVFAAAFPTALRVVFEYQPFSLYLTLARSCVMPTFTSQPWEWALGAGWAALAFGFGFIFFWGAEARYGRE
jgi:teichoic acid transport system permease protein